MYIINNQMITQNHLSHRIINSIYNNKPLEVNLTIQEKKRKEDNMENVFKILFNNHDYGSLKKMIPFMDVSEEEKFKIDKIVTMYNNWDLYEYDSIDKYKFDNFPEIFKPIEEQYNTNIKALKKIRTKYKEYQLLIDLINNASRRNVEGKNNEAIIELYRAMELITHLRLLKVYKIDTHDVDLNRLIDRGIDKNYVNYLSNFSNSHNTITLTLKEHFQLLTYLKDPIAKFFHEHHDVFMNIIKMRHSSLLIHGTTNITSLQYQELEYLVKELACKLNKKLKKYIKETEFPKLT